MISLEGKQEVNRKHLMGDLGSLNVERNNLIVHDSLQYEGGENLLDHDKEVGGE